MSIPRCPPVLIVLLIWTTQAAAGETAKRDRSIAKEPVYQTEKLQYWLLVVGPEAKTRVWVVRDGDVLYVDRNGDGDLTAADERLPLEHGRLREPLRITAGAAPLTIVSLDPRSDGYYVKVDTEGRRLQYAVVKPAASRKDAPAIHFDGRLVMSLAHTDPSKQPLRRGSKPYSYSGMVTTVGAGENGSWGPVIDHEKYLPEDVHPVAEFEFAAKKSEAGPVKLKTIKLKTVLDVHC